MTPSLFMTAAQFRKQQAFQKAINIYIPLWKENSEQFDQWAGWNYAFCLSGLNKNLESLEVCRKMYLRFNDFELLNNLYAKNIYRTQFIDVEETSLETLKKATTGIFRLSPPENKYSIAPFAIFKLVKKMMAQQNIHWQEIENWLNKLDPDTLDDDSFKIKDQKGRVKELASPQEQWYADMIKTKAGLSKPEELLEALKAARRKNIKWHYNNDIWFARKEAFAYQQLGNRKKAEGILRKIVVKKREWFLIYDLAQVVSDEKEALQLLCQSALARGKNEMKMKLYQSIFSKIKQDEKLKKEAGLHLCLIAALREENNWDIPAEVLENIAACDIDPVKQGSSSSIIEKLKPFWQKESGIKPKERLKGKITKVFGSKKAGFIQSGDQSYFFSVRDIKGEPVERQSVSFEWLDSFDPKKNKASKKAIKILVE